MRRDERRSFPRRKTSLLVKYTSAEQDPPRDSARSRTRDISAGGAYFTTLRAYALGEILSCEIEFSDNGPSVVLQGHVVRCEELPCKMVPSWGVAVEFIPGTKVKRTLSELLKTL